jgi:hypothetical protein
MAKKKTETVVVTWRVKEALRRRLEAAAADNEVSVNAEITRRIAESFSRAALIGLTENVFRLSTLYERALVSEEVAERFSDNAKKCLELAQHLNDSERKLMLLEMANSWLRLAAQRAAPDDVDLGLAPPGPGPYTNETPEERQARLRASADDLLKKAKRNEARSGNDLGAEPREWDTRAPSVPPRRATARSRLLGRELLEPETDEQWQARLRATAEGFRRNAKRHEARGAHDKAAEARERADQLEREARSVSDQEPELPMPRQKGGKS